MKKTIIIKHKGGMYMIIESTTKKRLADEYEALSLSLFLDSKKKEIYKLCKIYDSPDLKVKYDNFINLCFSCVLLLFNVFC